MWITKYQSVIEDSQNNDNNNNDNIQEGVYFVKSTNRGATFNKELRLNSEVKPGEMQISC